MNIISVDKITKSYGERKLFNQASFFLQEGQKVGVLGINGTGKSTLLKMIVGEEEPDAGTIIKSNGHVISYLPQTPAFEKTNNVLEAVLQGTNHTESDAKTMLTKLGVSDFSAICEHMSGGELKRLALVRTLLAPADILILDEPTNHLDQGMADWLEEQLKHFRGSIIMITHDRYFLDSVCNRIIEVDKGQIFSYEASYEGFLQLKSEREEMQLASDRKRHSILRTELKWIQRGAQARATKQKARLQRYEQMSRVMDAQADQEVSMSSVSSRLGRTTIILQDLCKSYDENVLIRNFSYTFLKNDRVGFLGHNGCGKSTLLKMIIGDESPDHGSIEIGQTVKIGYFAQNIGEQEMKPEMRVIDYIRNVAERIQTEDGQITAAKLLEQFLFEGEDQYGPIGKLSGGQRRRLYLCKVLMSAPNVLILDEPTNDLDVTTLTVLEDYLDQFAGIVIVVSHDRYFLDRVVGRLFVFEEDGYLRQSEGGYTDYKNRLAMQDEPLKTGNGISNEVVGISRTKASEEMQNVTGNRLKWNANRERKLKFSYQEQRDYETIEARIAAIETEIAQLEQSIAENARDYGKLRELTEEREKKEKNLEELMDRWMYLEDLAERIAGQ